MNYKWRSFFIPGLLTFFFIVQPVLATETSGDEWEFEADLYVWTPDIDIDTEDGGEIVIDFDEILENLEGLLMGGLKARRGKWSYQLDLIYFKIEDDESALGSIPFGLRDRHSLDVGLDADVTIEAWIVTPTVGYNLVDSQLGSLDVIGGVRYLNIDIPVDLETTVGPITQSDSISTRNDWWDAIVGVKGEVYLAPKWYAKYYLDAGGGDSDLTWQGYLGAAYRFEKVELHGGYRYLDYEFKSDDELRNLTVKGPQIGLKWKF
jgi:hypothetical protein